MSGAQPPELRLVTDIARQLAHLDQEEAAERLATHLEKFWPPPMRQALAAYCAAGADLDPEVDALITSAVARLVLDQVDHEAVRAPSGG